MRTYIIATILAALYVAILVIGHPDNAVCYADCYDKQPNPTWICLNGECFDGKGGYKKM